MLLRESMGTNSSTDHWETHFKVKQCHREAALGRLLCAILLCTARRLSLGRNDSHNDAVRRYWKCNRFVADTSHSYASACIRRRQTLFRGRACHCCGPVGSVRRDQPRIQKSARISRSGWRTPNLGQRSQESALNVPVMLIHAQSLH
jgi:hypothetical protein